MRIVPVGLVAALAPAAGSGTASAATPAQVGRGADLVRWDGTLVPAGATASTVSAAGTLTAPAVRGLVPHRAYGAHVHTKQCGASPGDAGPHYQHVADPVQPSTGPAYLAGLHHRRDGQRPRRLARGLDVRRPASVGPGSRRDGGSASGLPGPAVRTGVTRTAR